jgi:hypothetical protein
MYRTASNIVILALALVPRGAVIAQQASSNILSSEIAVSRERAEIKLEFDDGRKATFATVDGAPGLQRSGTARDEIFTIGARRGSALDRSWRQLLNQAMEVETASLAPMLSGWSPPSGVGAAFDAALEGVVGGTMVAPAAPAAPVAPGMNDSLARLEQHLADLQEQLKEARSDAISASRRHRGPDWLAPLRHVGRGISGIFATLVTYAVIFGIGFVTIMLGGRKYIEGVADTVRAGKGRAFLVGLAGAFLIVPVFVLGIIALAISIVGIPALLVWIPLFPAAVVASALLGFLGLAHATGEAWAERRYSGSEWITRANSYYFIATGLGLLAALFVAANVITMAGPWLGGLNNLLNFFGFVVTVVAAIIGFGAVLISRAGSRVDGRSTTLDSTAYSEANV